MSAEATTERADGQPKPEPAPQHPRGWLRFHQKLVLVQLAVPYGAVKFPNAPARMSDVNPQVDPRSPENGIAYCEALPGVLYVEQNADGSVLLMLETAAAPDGRDRATIAIHPSNVNYCTMVERSLIERS